MPLPEMWGKYCPGCGFRQPTLDELCSRIPEPTERNPDYARELPYPFSGGFVTILPDEVDEGLNVDVFESARKARERRGLTTSPDKSET